MSSQLRMGIGFALLMAGTPALAQAPANFDLSLAGHVIRRMEYGASVSDVVSVMGPNINFVNYALAQSAPGPESGEADSLVKLYPSFPITLDPTTGQADLGIVPTVAQPAGLTLGELQEVNIALALTSENQLREKLTQFWQKHFNTNYNKLVGVLQSPTFGLTGAQAQQYAAHFEWQQNAEFRANALGDFRDLLETSARGVAMSIYLDGVTNLKGPGASTPNQNFGRELLELHTLGVEGWRLNGATWVKGATYEFADILAMSRVFSGHELVNTGTAATPNLVLQFDGTKHFILDDAVGPQSNVPVFSFNPLFGSAPLLLNESITTDTEIGPALDYLARHPHTTLHVISQLWEYFIGGEAPDPTNATLGQAFAAWGPRGDIAAVMAVLLTSPEFLSDPGRVWNQARLPMEIVGQLLDTMNGSLFDPAASAGNNRAKLTHVRDIMGRYMGRFLFQFGAPDGFPFESDKQLTTLRLLGAGKLRQELYSNVSLANPFPFYGPADIHYDPGTLLASLGVDLTNELQVANVLALLLFTGDSALIDEQYLADILMRDVNGLVTVPLALDSFPNQIDRLSRAFAFGASLSLNNLK